MDRESYVILNPASPYGIAGNMHVHYSVYMCFRFVTGEVPHETPVAIYLYLPGLCPGLQSRGAKSPLILPTKGSDKTR